MRGATKYLVKKTKLNHGPRTVSYCCFQLALVRCIFMLLMHLLPPRRRSPQLPASYYGAGISFRSYHRTVARLRLRQNVPSIARTVALCCLGLKITK